jgi:LysM repeat protein
MAHCKHALALGVPILAALIGVACLPGDGSDSTEPTATPQAGVQGARTAPLSSASPTPAPTQLPVLPVLTTYTVKSGDYPTLIAETAGVPVDEQDAWIAEMLALNGVDATSLQIGQKLILPPFGNGGLPTVRSDAADDDEPEPPAAAIEPAEPDDEDEPAPDVTATPTPGAFAGGGVPFAPTPPFVAFTSPSPTPTSTPLPTATPTPSPTPTIAPGERAWLTSSEETAKYYYCDLDDGWRDIPAEKLLAFDSEQQLLAIWGRFRTRAPDSVC